MKDALFYKIIRPIITFLFKIVYTPKINGKENIPANDAVILAGTHTNILDCLLLISSTKRNIHFLAKKELWKGPKKIIFSNLELIPVDRKNKDHQAIESAEKYLKSNLLVCIFPEGTTEKEGKLLPFKMGTVKIASDVDCPIVPFVIKGKYHPFSRSLTIKFLKPIKISGDLEKENDRFREIIRKERESKEI